MGTRSFRFIINNTPVCINTKGSVARIIFKDNKGEVCNKGVGTSKNDFLNENGEPSKRLLSIIERLIEYRNNPPIRLHERIVKVDTPKKRVASDDIIASYDRKLYITDGSIEVSIEVCNSTLTSATVVVSFVGSDGYKYRKSLNDIDMKTIASDHKLKNWGRAYARKLRYTRESKIAAEQEEHYKLKWVKCYVYKDEVIVSIVCAEPNILAITTGNMSTNKSYNPGIIRDCSPFIKFGTNEIDENKVIRWTNEYIDRKYFRGGGARSAKSKKILREYSNLIVPAKENPIINYTHDKDIVSYGDSIVYLRNGVERTATFDADRNYPSYAEKLLGHRLNEVVYGMKIISIEK